jgi:NAD(P)-dependent dehydrogenase (short-subunit alcohol dehydrogenase family)
MDMRLKDKVAVVLGASAEAGTGWAVAEKFAAEGAKVVVGARREEPLKKLAAKIGGVAQVCDVGNEEQVIALAKTAVDRFGKLDIAVNAAGVPMGGTITNTPTEELIRSTEVNYYGGVYFVRHMAAAMQGPGSIILVTSMTTTHPLEWVYSYACAKAGIDCLVRYAAIEYGPRGIKVNSILPGAIRSEMSAPLWKVPGMEESWTREVPLGRIGEPADFAEAALWLAGPSFVTGLNLQVNGGGHLLGWPKVSERPEVEGVDPTSGA